jgi:hypothetical protein
MISKERTRLDFQNINVISQFSNSIWFQQFNILYKIGITYSILCNIKIYFINTDKK